MFGWQGPKLSDPSGLQCDPVSEKEIFTGTPIG